MNKKKTIATLITSSLVGLTVGVGTAGVRYFKKEENREKFNQNSTVQKVRRTSANFAQRVKDGQVKLQTIVVDYKKQLDVADEVAEMQEKNISSETKVESTEKSNATVTKNSKAQPESKVTKKQKA